MSTGEQSVVEFGFLLDRRTFRATVPSSASGSFQASTSVGVTPAAALAVQAAPKSYQSFRDGWRHVFQANSGGQDVDVFERVDDTASVMPVWDLGPFQVWMQLRPDSGGTRSELLGLLLNGLQVQLDARGIPRVIARSRLVPGNPRANALNRDQVMFYARPGKVPWSVVFRRDDALGEDGLLRDSAICIARAATASGITVLCDGPSPDAVELQDVARQVAASLELVASS